MLRERVAGGAVGGLGDARSHRAQKACSVPQQRPPEEGVALTGQVADYEITKIVSDDGVLPCLRARRPPRLGDSDGQATIWVLGPLARTPWTVARARLEPVAAVRSQGLPDWLEAGVGEWGQRSVIWVSAATAVAGTLAAPPPDLDVPSRLRAIASAARGAHALHERGQLHGAICPQAVALAAPDQTVQAGLAIAGPGTGAAVLAPPSLANGGTPVAQVGYPPLAYMDPQLLRGEGGRWSDVWALGATVHQVLTGSTPYPAMEDKDIPVVQALAQLLMAPVPEVRELPATVSSLVAACLAFDPANRPSTAEEVASHLDEAAANW